MAQITDQLIQVVDLACIRLDQAIVALQIQPQLAQLLNVKRQLKRRVEMAAR